MPRALIVALFAATWLAIFSVSLWGLSPTAGAQGSPNGDLRFTTADMDFILEQIKFAERHAAGEDLLDILPNASVPWGLRTVDGSFNNLIMDQNEFGEADLEFPHIADRDFRDAQVLTFPLAGNDVVGAQTSYTTGDGRTVQDSTPRLISHLIVNQSVENPAAVHAAAANEDSEVIPADITGIDQLYIPNVAVDEGLSAPTNAFITFFGQFFDHGLDLINKGGNGLVFMPLQEDDPLYDPASPANFMMLTRASRDAGPDGIIGTEDDVSEPINATTPHVDQQQTYASHASAQVLLRHFEVRGGQLQDSGRLLDGFGNDRLLDTADDGGLATWDTVQAQALLKFGIELDDLDGANMPMIAADFYGNFIPGPARGLPQIVTELGPVEGDTSSPIDATDAIRVNHSFFLDVAHTAAPTEAGPDPDDEINALTNVISGQATRGIRAAGPDGTYDDELLGMHFACGDGRCNENIALTTVHHIFHAEHNRLSDIAKRVVLDAGDLARLNEWLDTPVGAFPAWAGLPFAIDDASLANQAAAHAAIEALNLDWNGARVFQAARFGTEMQYNRIVFDEFSPTLAGLKDVFEGFHTDVDPTITTEFSQSVYRFGHSMLTETVDRYDPDFAPIVDAATNTDGQLGLFEAFLNPLALYNSTADGTYTISPEQGAGAVMRGITRTRGNEIDEFVTGALQNNLVGLPLDLGAINIARGRDVGNPRLNDARRKFFAMTQDTRLAPYVHWADYADNLTHEPTLVNFIAAYGTHPTLAGPDGIIGNGDDPDPTYDGRRARACAIVGALTTDPAAYCAMNGYDKVAAETPGDALDFLFSRGGWAHDADGRATTGLEDIDLWNGGLAEERMPFGGYLGSTHNFIFETQLESLQNGDRFYYVGRTANLDLFGALESNSFTSIVMRNTDIGEAGGGALSLNIFSVPHHILEVNQDEQFDAAGDGTTADPEGDSELIPLVIRDADDTTTNIDVQDDTRFLQYTGGDHVVIGGTDGDDTIIGGIGDDTLSGGDGDDRIEGGDGADLIEGGAGDDIITDLSGPDVIEGGAGNDAISSGNEEDVIFGDDGNDFIVNSSELGEIFGGAGDDYILDGIHLGHHRGGAGDDWMENLGGGEDLFQGDNGVAAELGESPVKGNDVGIAHGGNNDFDMESGDDIVVDGPGIERAEGQLGFDWMSFQNDRFGVSIDLDLTIFLRPQLPPSNNTVLNRYDRVEGITGSPMQDILRGTDNEIGAELGNELVRFDLLEGIDAIVPLSERGPVAPDQFTGEPQFGWDGGEIILGGGGSDLLVGEGGDDIIDGDSALTVHIRTPDPEIRSGPLGEALRDAKRAAKTTSSQAEADATAAAAWEDVGAAAAAAVEAANIAAAAAVAAADEAEAALAETLTISDALGNLIEAAGEPVEVVSAWQAFLDSCTAVLVDLGLELQATTAATAAQALADQAEAVATELASTQEALEAAAGESADAAELAVEALANAQEALDEADQIVLVDGMQDVMDAIFGGFINPGELSIARIIADHDGADVSTDTAVFSGNVNDYAIDELVVPGFVQVLDQRLIEPNDGRDLVRNMERLQFADGTIVIDNDGDVNSLPVGAATISGVAEVGGVLTASADGVTDADNVAFFDGFFNSEGLILQEVEWTWEVELEPLTGQFTPLIRTFTNGDEFEVMGEQLELTVAEAGLRIRVVGIYVDADGVFETIRSLAVGGPVPGVCGDGVLNLPFEECDDGNLIDGDGCDALCELEDGVVPICGNGVPEDPEQCDDGNLVNGDGCSATCTIEVPTPVCGNGVQEAGEGCDDGNLANGDGCSAACQLEISICGNGVVEGTESCDDGNLLNGDGCSAACTLEVAVCGNGVVELGEACDDGNLVNGDGCSASCVIETPVPVCGNGVQEVGEACDDGNLVNGDGCSDVCELEGPLPVCGNGVLEAGEACDDGNLLNGDGCSAACTIEILPPSVAITDADWRGRNQQRIQVMGTATPFGTGVGIYAPGTVNGTNDGCDGTHVATVTAGEGMFSFNSARNSYPTNPGTVCVVTDEGEAAQAPVVTR